VEITGAPSGAQIRYTTDGNEPIETSYPYSDPFSPPSQETVTIKAKVFNSPDYLPSNTASVEYRFTPAAPIMGRAEANEKYSIAVTWQDNSSIEKSYEVDCSSETIAVGSGITGTTIAGLNPGTSYTCKVRARNSNGFSKWSASKTITTLNVYTLTLVLDDENVPDPSLVTLTGGGEYTEDEIIPIYSDESFEDPSNGETISFIWWWVDERYLGKVEWVESSVCHNHSGKCDCTNDDQHCEDHNTEIKISSNVVLEAIYY
jgi:hypothetical protein